MPHLQRAWQEIDAEAALLAKGGAFPIWTDGGEWVTVDFAVDERGILPHHGSWMVGDLPAILWFLATGSPEEEKHQHWRTAAKMWSERLTNRANTRSFASVSHMFFRGVLVGLATAGEESLRPLALTAARTVSDRFREIGYMKSFGSPGDTTYPFTTVDDVINLTIPLWLAEQTGDAELRAAAITAIDQIADGLIRSDGSTGQVLLIGEGGQPAGVDTYQGFSASGCWSRGQAWGIYGFATVYAQTREPRYLQVARDMARYWIEHVQDDPSPVWDFDLPAGEPVVRDSFAASLALAGMLELAASLPPSEARPLRDYARTMVTRLSADYVERRPRGHGLVADAALDVPHGHGVGSSVIVGDSYFTEAVWRLTVGEKLAGPSCLVPR